MGLVLPLLILSRLDDFLVLPALVIGIGLIDAPLRDRRRATLWAVGPSVIVILGYLIYNRMTVGSAMPLSGSTKSGFVGFLSAYLTAAVHFAPILDLKAALTHSPSDGATIFDNSFRFVEMTYPIGIGALAALVIWRHARHRADAFALFAIALYLVFKAGYNFVNVHPWHQAPWYYLFASMCISYLVAASLRGPWAALARLPVVKRGVSFVYLGVALLASSQYYASVAYGKGQAMTLQFWERRAAIRNTLLAHDVKGLINVDDGITAFLLDLPMLHGFAFAADVESQRAEKAGTMLSLAYSRGINGLTGFGYLATDIAPSSDAEIRAYLSSGLAAAPIRADIDRFRFSLAYYDPVLKLPFIKFQPKAAR